MTFLHTPPKVATQGLDVVITGNIVGADQVNIAALNFRRQGETEYQVRELKLISGEQYHGTIPGKFIKPPALEYFCYAVDFDGNRRSIFASEENPHRVEVAAHKPDRDNWADESEPQPDRHADTPAEPEKPGPGEPVTTMTPIQATHPTTILSGSQIEALGVDTLAEVLDFLPGMTVSRTVSGGRRLAVRGIQSDADVLILLDGQRINDLYTGATFLEFPAEAIERVEVVRGPGALQFGSGALAGLVNVVTRKQPDFRARAGYGQFASLRLSGQGGYQTAGFGLGGQVQFVNSAGQDGRVVSDALTGVQADDPVSNAPGLVEDHRTQLHAQLQGNLSNLGGGELALLAHYLFQTRGALVGKYDTLDSGSGLSTHRINLDLSYRVELGASVQLDSRASFAIHSVEDKFNVIPDGEQPYHAGTVQLTDGLSETIDYQSMSLGAEVLARAILSKDNILIGGLQFEHLGLSDLAIERDAGSVSCPDGSSLLVRGYDLPCARMEGRASGEERMLIGFFATDQWSDILEGLDASAGFRLDYFSDAGLVVSPQGGLSYRPLEGLRFKAAYAQLFRAPTFQELYQQPQFDPLSGLNGNQDLGMVKVHSLELAVEGDLKARPMLILLRGVFFYTWIRDGIAPAGETDLNPQLGNDEALDVLGAEGELTARFGKRGRLVINGSWFLAKVSAASSLPESFISDVPQMRFNLGLDLPLTDWLDLHLGVQYGSERRNNARRHLEFFRPFLIPAYTLVRAGISTEPVLFDHLVLFAYLSNLFDHDMRDPAPRPDRLPGLVPRAPFEFMAGIGWRP